MSARPFTLDDRHEVEQFQAHVEHIVRSRHQFLPNHVSLPLAYDRLQERADGGRVFSALVDLFLTFVFLYLDQADVAGTWNAYFSAGKLSGGSALDDPRKFLGKFTIHRYATSYVLRYRALWDKVMGFIVLLEAPGSYDGFSGARSKKKAFAKLAASLEFIHPEDAAAIVAEVGRFDDGFRTAEAHGTGVLRKWTFTMAGIAENPQIELVGYWNFVNITFAKLMEHHGFAPHAAATSTT